MRVKICGITNVADAVAAAEAGADAIGLNFVGGPRQIDGDRAREILAAMPPLVTPVALVRVEDDQLADDVAHLLGELWVSHLQVYGEVTPPAMTLLVQDGFRPMPVVTVGDETFADGPVPWWSLEYGFRPSAVVLDAYDPEREGGTGKTFRWDWVVAAREAGKLSDWPAILLAGGLHADNVAEAVRTVRPFGVDVSSGVEREGEPGAKDPERMRSFVRNAKHA